MGVAVGSTELSRINGFLHKVGVVSVVVSKPRVAFSKYCRLCMLFLRINLAIRYLDFKGADVTGSDSDIDVA